MAEFWFWTGPLIMFCMRMYSNQGLSPCWLFTIQCGWYATRSAAAVGRGGLPCQRGHCRVARGAPRAAAGPPVPPRGECTELAHPSDKMLSEMCRHADPARRVVCRSEGLGGFLAAVLAAVSQLRPSLLPCSKGYVPHGAEIRGVCLQSERKSGSNALPFHPEASMCFWV